MTDEQFIEWAKGREVPPVTVEELLAYAASDEEMQIAIRDEVPGPPLFNLGSIAGMSEKAVFGPRPLDHGLIMVGSCPNGDPIVIDIEVDKGSVWYLAGSRLYESPLRDIAVRASDNLKSWMTSLENEENFPFNYFDAKQKWEA